MKLCISRLFSSKLALLGDQVSTDLVCSMLLQISDKVEPPKGFMKPDWQGLSQQWKARIERDGAEARKAVESFPASTVRMGQDDSDAADLENPMDSNHSFGWDNEHGVRQVEGKSAELYFRIITEL